MPNIEIKAKCTDVNSVRLIAENLKTQYVGKLHQVDTYFTTQQGRLKLWEINGKESQLIPYFKEYSTGPIKSSYSVLTVSDPKNVKDIFNKILGTVTIVDKKREVFLIDNVRVHLDEVKDLGTFIEFEAVYEENSPEDKEREVSKVYELMDTFQINQLDLLDKSCVDYLLSKNHPLFDISNILYAFESEFLIIAEFKRTDIDQSLSPDRRLFWLTYDKDTKKLNRLDFSFMDRRGEKEHRSFKQGTLIFDKNNATFTNSNDSINLTHVTSDFLSKDFKDTVYNYLKSL